MKTFMISLMSLAVGRLYWGRTGELTVDTSLTSSKANQVALVFFASSALCLQVMQHIVPCQFLPAVRSNTCTWSRPSEEERMQLNSPEIAARVVVCGIEDLRFEVC